MLADRLRIAGTHVHRDGAQPPGAREDRRLNLQAGRQPRARDAVSGGNGRARAERHHDRRLARRAWLLGVLGHGVGRRRVEFVKERVRGGRAGPFASPHDLAALMVDHEREVLVLALPADLVDANVVEIVQAAGIELVVADALDDPPDRVPVDPQHPLDRRLVSPRRQPRDQTLEIARELGARPGERDALRARPMLRAPQAPATAMDLKPPDPEIKMPPDRVLRPRVLTRPRRVPALGADQPPASQRHLDHDNIGLEANLPDPHPRQTQKPGKCRRDAHAVPPCKPLTLDSQQPAGEGGGRVPNQRATCENYLRPAKTCSRGKSRRHHHHIDAGRPTFWRRSTCTSDPRI